MIVDIYEYFKQHPKFNKRIGNNFVLVEYKCPLNVEEFQLWTESHMIVYVIKGKKDWITADRTFNLSQGDVIFVKKGVYTTKQYFEEDYCVMLFFMNDDFLKDFFHQNKAFNIEPSDDLISDAVLKIDVDNSFNTLVNSVFHYLTQGQSIPEDLVELKFKELIFNVTLNKENQALKKLLIDISRSSKANIEHVLNMNFLYDLSLDALAKLSGRSLSSFKRDFNEQYGTTPSKWLIEKRLEYSKTLLISTQMNINEVCHESGFKNASHFVKSFKTRFNLTPKQFRANKPSGSE